MEYLDLTLSILPQSKGFISQYTSQGVYELMVNETYEGIISFMINNRDSNVKMTRCRLQGGNDEVRMVRMAR